MKSKQVRSMAYRRTKEFLTLPGEDRFARLMDLPPLPRPVKAFLSPDGHLTWTWYSVVKERKEGDTRRPPALQTAPADLCFEFAQLAHGAKEEIVAFAGRWGPLLGTRDVEHINAWRRYARLAAALLRFTGERASGGLGDTEDWRIICKSTVPGVIDRVQLTSQQQTAITASAVNTWFAKARGHRVLAVVDGKLQIRPAASNLFGVLIMQIAHVMARTDQVAICAGCRNAFTPKRPISRGSRQYCRRCRKAKVPQRDASRDWRRRAHPKE
jgi:hypothetical protein